MGLGTAILPDLLQASLVFETRGCGVGSFVLTGHLTQPQVHQHVSPFQAQIDERTKSGIRSKLEPCSMCVWGGGEGGRCCIMVF